MVDLPAYENDVLHALAATGGLPGVDGQDWVWVLRGAASEPGIIREISASEEIGENPEAIAPGPPVQCVRHCIPLRVYPDQPLPFQPADVVLQNGDVVYVEHRLGEYFYTGGLLRRAQIPLPRDHDVDVTEAIAMATGAVGAAAVGGVGAQGRIRQGAGPGNVLVPPTRVILVRKLSNGRQLRIRVDLEQAVHDEKERILVQPGDLLMLQFTPSEGFANTVLNWFNWNLSLAGSGSYRGN